MATWIRVPDATDAAIDRERAAEPGAEVGVRVGAARLGDVRERELPQGVEWRGFDLSDLMVFATLCLALSGMFGGFSI